MTLEQALMLIQTLYAADPDLAMLLMVAALDEYAVEQDAEAQS
jgi:hypothetical protein